MATIRLVFYIVYKYYSMKGWKRDVAYLATVLLFVSLLGLNLFALIHLLHLPNFIPIDLRASRFVVMIEVGLFIMLPGYLLISLFIKEDDIMASASEQLVLPPIRVIGTQDKDLVNLIKS